MLTFVSQSIRRFFDTRSPEARERKLQALFAAAGAPLRPAPSLRLLQGGGGSDIPIAPAAVLPSASAFVAGQGARIYSLEVFRRGERLPPRPQGPRHAA